VEFADHLDQPLASVDAVRNVALTHSQEGTSIMEPYVGDLLLDPSGVYFLALRRRSAWEHLLDFAGFIPGVNIVALPLMLLLPRVRNRAPAAEALRERKVGDLIVMPGSLHLDWGEVRNVSAAVSGLRFDTYRGRFSFTGSGLPSPDTIHATYGSRMPATPQRPGRASRLLHKKIF
jgi:hypothetical protein